MLHNAVASATTEVPLEAGWTVYDREGCRVGLVDEVRVDQDAFTILQAGLALGWIGGEFVVPRPLIADTRADSIILNVSAEELQSNRVRRN